MAGRVLCQFSLQLTSQLPMKLGSRSRRFLARILSGVLLYNLILSPVVSQSTEGSTQGFISISCGGVSGVDPVTSLDWITDESHLDSYKSLFDGNVITTADVQYNESSPSVPNDEQLKTALVFLPNQMTRSKFCYNLPIAFNATEGSRNYLLRAMFPSQNLTVNGKALSGYATRFYLTVDSTYITTIQLLPSIPQTIELVVSSLDDKFYVCLVPLEDKSSMPAISTLELRPFNPDTYDRSGQSKEKQQSSYLMLVDRYDFGGILDTESPPLRFPADPFDRIWSSPRIPEGAQFEAYNRTEDANLGYGGDNVRFPIAVMRSIWRGKNLSSTMNFEVNVKSARAHRPLPTFWFQILCSNVVSGDVNPHQSVRLIDGDLAGGWGPFEVPGSPNFIQLLSNDLLIRSDSFTIRIEPNETTEAPVLVNAAEIHGEFAAVAVRTSKLDVDAVQRFSTNLVSNSLDTAGDPCLPIPWDWLVCSIELPPTITQINLTTKAVLGELDLEVSLLSRLTVLDLSNNHFNGRVPLTLVNVSTLRALDFSRNNFSGQIPPFPADSFMNLEYISFSQNQLVGNLSYLMRSLTQSVKGINLRDNAFIGPIPAEIVKFENLESLDLSGNNLSQGLPTELGKLQSLKTLYLNDNLLSGAITDTLWSSKLENINMENNNFTELNLTSWYYLVRGKKELNTSSVQRVRLMGNPISIVHIPSDDALDDLIRPSQTSGQLSEQNSNSFILLGGSPWCLARGGSESTLAIRYLCRTNEAEDFWLAEDSGNRTLLIVAITVGVGALVSAAILLFFLRNSWKRIQNLQQIQDALAKLDVRPPFYKYEELKAATNEFSKNNELGRGAFGAVYKAVFADGTILAVKRLYPTDQNVIDFFKEMVLISGIKHTNLIQLRGCCVREKERMLVYEFAENMNLAEALWGSSRPRVLNWDQRKKIAVGIARGLSYLHEELQPKIIHRDIKPQNILLDKYLNAKIADFGLARPADEDKTQLATHVGGTRGYFSPEYATLGMFTEKLDVYSFGILLLEIVAGRPCLRSVSSTLSEEEMYLRVWASDLLRRDKLMDMVDHDLVGNCSQEEVVATLKIALSCVQQEAKDRPYMSQVVSMLTGLAALPF
ncbi:hypothetical protein MPTK1_6g17510 [Marchantia polymorpha subsp. ruderalis]|uniref:Protein kinase domain-containing protein n=2 Tax=Marchantia polymorpha TaxID=3197 RepID=A0AAF6BT22_MARPO|nr:hypothetical protein MARPO_0265s0002 [Marchantia polymorpha]PTQ26935.1 hypothetical protein MARPO_0265s0002 [Marchantia polymorpha]PTQ26936.1 hypothetical protein MARPO_0265s0002 [Marchantia polymorpha]BBN15156.1 hypothetical protein Mp_6g17510 [Marchantia polymorpha subsp. ruderalis]|eukprot:PTQ26934.1 hypothetical protein MARPO_0265s0002 [Marchantia polymorpha]